MSNQYGLNKYKQTSVTTANRGKLLLMLYEAAIKYTKLSIAAIEKKDLVAKGQNIVKIQDIVNELSLSLDHEVGGDISKELDGLYNYIVQQITDANINNDVKPLESSLKILETLYEGWQGAVEQMEKQGVKPQEAVNIEKKPPTNEKDG